MKTEKINLRELKKMRLERHWSQEQLAEMSGLSIRTIQRIENGENASFESLKALAAVFETNIIDSDKGSEMEQAKKEDEYIENVKGFYMVCVVACMILLIALISAVKDAGNWGAFGGMFVFWAIFIGVSYIDTFDVFGKDWKERMIDKRFKRK
ncbi:helix-turn-helix domain-containing protein [Wenyingzhuangia sp. IMCC45574]